MNIGSMKEVLLSNARDVFLFDCQAAGLDPQIRYAYRDVLASFTRFTGNILVKDLTPNHVRAYIGNLADGPREGEEHIRSVKNHYAVIHTWILWLDEHDIDGVEMADKGILKYGNKPFTALGLYLLK